MIAQAFHALYRQLRALIAHNQDLIGGHRPAKRQEMRWRMAFVAAAALLGGYVAYAFGQALAQVLPFPNPHLGGWRMLFMLGSGWLAIAALAKFATADWGAYVGHLATIMLAGGLMCVPWMLLHLIQYTPLPFTLAMGGLVSFGTMAWLHARRAALLGLPRWWTLLWAACLLGGLAAGLFCWI
jgi:hypothetical protein